MTMIGQPQPPGGCRGSSGNNMAARHWPQRQHTNNNVVTLQSCSAWRMDGEDGSWIVGGWEGGSMGNHHVSGCGPLGGDKD